MNWPREYPHLANLICGYFNQDWNLYFSDWIKLIDFLIAETHPAAKRNLIADIDKILEAMDEDELGAYFKQHYADIEPPYMAGMSHVVWLCAVRDMLRASHESFAESWQSYPCMVVTGAFGNCDEKAYRDPFPDVLRYRTAGHLTERLEKPEYQGSLLSAAGSAAEIEPRLIASDSMVIGIARRLVLIYAAGAPLAACVNRLKDDLPYLRALHDAHITRWGTVVTAMSIEAGAAGAGLLRSRDRTGFNYLALGCLLLTEAVAMTHLFDLVDRAPRHRRLATDWLLSAFAANNMRPLVANEDAPDTGRYSYDPLWEALLHGLSADSAKEKQAALSNYMSDWGALMRPHGWRKLRRYCPLDDGGGQIDPNCRGDDLFIDFAFEAALVVCAWDLDDSEFRDHPYYPVDLVDYYRSRVRHTRDAWRKVGAGPIFQLPES